MALWTGRVGAVLVAVAAMMWGFDGVVLTPRLFNLDVGYVVFMVHALPFAAMNIFLFREYRRLATLSRADLAFMFLIALFGGALGTLAIVKALFLVHFQQLTVVALLQKLQPVFAVALARLILGERFGPRFLLWAVAAIVAGYILTFEFNTPALVNDGNMLPAAMYSVFAAFAFGSSTVFGKRVLFKLPHQAALFFRYGMTTGIMAVVLIFTGAFDQISATTGQNWFLFAVIGATTGSGAIWMYYYGLKRISAGESTILELCFPISTVVFDYLFNGSVLSPVRWVSGAVMLIAIYKIGTEKRDPPADAASQDGPRVES